MEDPKTNPVNASSSEIDELNAVIICVRPTKEERELMRVMFKQLESQAEPLKEK